MTIEEALKLPDFAKVVYRDKVYDYGYVGQTWLLVLYEEGERNMQDAIAVSPEDVRRAAKVACDSRVVALLCNAIIDEALARMPAVLRNIAAARTPQSAGLAVLESGLEHWTAGRQGLALRSICNKPMYGVGCGTCEACVTASRIFARAIATPPACVLAEPPGSLACES